MCEDSPKSWQLQTVLLQQTTGFEGPLGLITVL